MSRETLRNILDALDARPVIFSYPGVVEAGVVSPRWYAEGLRRFAATRITAATAGAGDLTVNLNLNGTLVVTVTLGSAANTAAFASPFEVVAGDYLDVETTAVDGQANVTVQVHCVEIPV